MTVGNITQVKLPAMIYLTGVGSAWRTGRRGVVEHNNYPERVDEYRTEQLTDPSYWILFEAGRLEVVAVENEMSQLVLRLPDPTPSRVEFEVKLPERYQRQMQQRPIQRAPRTDAREVGGTIHHYGITERCRGDCSRGGEGPACGKPGCTG